MKCLVFIFLMFTFAPVLARQNECDEADKKLLDRAELATANGIKVVLFSVIPVSDAVRRGDGPFYIQTGARPPARIVLMNKWLKDYSAKNG